MRFNEQHSEKLGVGVSLNQGSVLSPPLLYRIYISIIIIVPEALSCEFRYGVPWEVLHCLVVIADSNDECIA